MSSADSRYVYYSLKALSTEMVTDSVTIQNYVSGMGPRHSSVVSYTGDMEELAMAFLQAMDGIIAPFTGNNVLPPPAMNRILAAKESLVVTIAQGICNILEGSMPVPLLDAAERTMKKTLRNSLAHGFGTCAIIVDKTTKEVTPFYRGNTAASIPVAVRTCPQPVTLLDQSSFATWPEADTAEQAAQCQYSFSWSYNGIPEDTVWIRLTQAPSDNGPVPAQSKLLNALVQFANVYPHISEDLPRSYKSADAGNAVITGAYNAFADIAEAMAEAWEVYAPDSLPSRIAGHGLIYGMQHHHDKGCLTSVSLWVKEASTADVVIPALFVKNVNGKYEQLEMTKTGDSSYEYTYTGNDKSDGCNIVAEFACNDIYSPQPTLEAVVARNWTENVNTDLVYQAATAFPQPISIYLEQTERFDLRSSDKPVAGAMLAFFQTILAQFGGVPQISISVQYTYPLTGDSTAPWLSLPVLLVPKNLYSYGLAANIAQAATDWRKTTEPPAGGHFSMKVTMYNAIDQPVLLLQEVVF